MVAVIALSSSRMSYVFWSGAFIAASCFQTPISGNQAVTRPGRFLIVKKIIWY
jgi:hypothetical protein